MTMTGSKSRLIKWSILAIASLVVVETLYLLTANQLLNGGFLAQMLNRNPDSFRIEWASGWTILPGHLRVTGLSLSGQTAEQEWWLSIGQGEARVALASLLFKTLRLKGVELDNQTAGVRADSACS